MSASLPVGPPAAGTGGLPVAGAGGLPIAGLGGLQVGPGADLLGEARRMEIWRTYFETSQRVMARLQARLKEDAGMDASDYNLLMVLAEAPERTLQMSVLADRIVFSVPRLSYRIGVLVERGWVDKLPCADDRRAHNIVLTEDGARALMRAGRDHRREIHAVFDGVLNEEDMAALERVMGKMRAAVDS